MPIINVLGEINHFLDCGTSPTLELTFSRLDIQSFHKGQLLNHTVKQQAQLCIHLPKENGLAQLDVLDHLVFSFSSRFVPPTNPTFYRSEALQLPRPLAQGSLAIDAEKLVLEFMIDAPNKDVVVGVKHTYTHTMHVKYRAQKTAQTKQQPKKGCYDL